jgi:hypothetical protein
MTAVGSKTRCAVNHGPGYVPGECSGEIHLYRSLRSTGQWWLCDADAENAPSRGVWVEPVNEPEEAS